MDEEMEMEEEIAHVYDVFEIDFNCEFDATRFFDFTRPESEDESRYSESLFSRAPVYFSQPLHSNFRRLISSICASRGLRVYMSFNESRFDKNESRFRKPSGGRSGRGSGGQQRNFLSRRGRGGGSNPTTITAPPDLNT